VERAGGGGDDAALGPHAAGAATGAGRLADWPLRPMAEAITGASRAAVQRNLAWMETKDLVREVTGQGRFRMWRMEI